MKKLIKPQLFFTTKSFTAKFLQRIDLHLKNLALDRAFSKPVIRGDQLNVIKMLSLSNFKKFEISSETVKGGIKCSEIIDVIEHLSSFEPGSNEYEQGKVVTAAYANGQIQCD